MRVIAGSLKGRRLAAPRGQGTRPTSDRVREAVFSMLGEIDGARVLDLFAGTGALGIEAISRGAAQAVFVESDRAAVASLQRNLRTLGLEESQAQVRPVQALAALRAARQAGERFDLVFVDPPYRQAATLGPALSRELAPVLAAGARVVAESDRRERLRLELPVGRERSYGHTSITIHRAHEP